MKTIDQLIYDNYVTSGSGDMCFQNGMSGHCGLECSVFGSKPECFDGMTEEQRQEWLEENGE